MSLRLVNGSEEALDFLQKLLEKQASLEKQRVTRELQEQVNQLQDQIMLLRGILPDGKDIPPVRRRHAGQREQYKRARDELLHTLGEEKLNAYASHI